MCIRNANRFDRLDEAGQRLLMLLAQFHGQLTADDIRNIEEMVDAGEPGVGFENFCTQLYERNARCSPEQVAEIKAIGEILTIDPWYWELIDPSIPFRPWPTGENS